jgi:hypothetical protein
MIALTVKAKLSALAVLAKWPPVQDFLMSEHTPP